MFDDNSKRDNQPRVGRSTVLRGRAAINKLRIGLDLAVDTVGATLGPRGKCVIIAAADENSPPIVTKDGVTVSKAVDPVDPVERMGAQLVREAASRTNDEAGDGTTTATILTGALVTSVTKYVTAGFESTEIKRGLDEGVAAILENLKETSEKIDTEEALKDVATISANGDATIGDLVAQAVHRTGRDGVVTVENARSSATSLEIVEGLRFERGYLSPYFVNDQEKMRVVYEDCAVLITDRKLSSLKDLVPLLEDCRRSNDRPLLIIAEELEGDAMQGLVLNRAHGNLKVVGVKLPGIGSERDAQMHDLIALVGGEQPTVSSGIKLENVKVGTIGVAKKVIVDAKTTTIVGRLDAKERVEQRVAELRKQLEDVALSKEEEELVRRRLAKLTSGAAIVRVGGATELELTERKYRIEDALHAARAALEEGILPGGGTALFRIRRQLEKLESTASILAVGDARAAGWRAALEACDAPLRRIVKNAGQSPDVVCDRCETVEVDNTAGWGWNVTTASVVDMRAAGVIDPCKVTVSALKNAASVAGVFLQLDCVVHEPTESNKDK